MCGFINLIVLHLLFFFRHLATKIFVGGLASETSDREFKEYFQKFGEVKDAVVMFDRDTNRSRGFGFVTFETEAATTAAVSQAHELGGKFVDVKRAQPLHSKDLESSTQSGRPVSGMSDRDRGGGAQCDTPQRGQCYM